MKNPSKAELLKQNSDLSHQLELREQYLSHAFRSEVTFIQKGATRLGICGECRAHGGIVLEAIRDNSGKWYVAGVYYWEAFAARVRAYPYRHDDKEGQDLRTCMEQVAKHVAEKQAAFYAPKVAAACAA